MRSLLPAPNNPVKRQWLTDLTGPRVNLINPSPEVRERMRALEFGEVPVPALKYLSNGTLFVMGPEGQENYLNWCALQVLRYSAVLIQTIPTKPQTATQNAAEYRAINAKVLAEGVDVMEEARANGLDEEEEEEDIPPEEDDDWIRDDDETDTEVEEQR